MAALGVSIFFKLHGNVIFLQRLIPWRQIPNSPNRLKCSNLLGSLIWASGLIPLDCLYLRPLQRHFHTLGLTNWFTPPCCSDPLVLANLLRLWNPHPTFPGGVHDSYGRLYPGLGRPDGGFPDFGFWTRSDRELHINT